MRQKKIAPERAATSVKLPKALKEKFYRLCRLQNEIPAKVLRQFISQYIQGKFKNVENLPWHSSMIKQKEKKQEFQLVVRMDRDELTNFLKECRRRDRSISQEIRGFMRRYIANHTA
ncbi:hypothetical protein CI610_00760 [invertebrate metagenome]|uniref:Uncharacterized protein n=1 Tax=invertebrate metagenome TaxID=1711999 RepID=A0A2H9TAI6_9ZZZZ